MHRLGLASVDLLVDAADPAEVRAAQAEVLAPFDAVGIDHFWEIGTGKRTGETARTMAAPATCPLASPAS